MNEVVDTCHGLIEPSSMRARTDLIDAVTRNSVPSSLRMMIGARVTVFVSMVMSGPLAPLMRVEAISVAMRAARHFQTRRRQYGRIHASRKPPIVGTAQACAGHWVRLGGGFFVHAFSVFFFAVFDMATGGNTK